MAAQGKQFVRASKKITSMLRHEELEDFWQGCIISGTGSRARLRYLDSEFLLLIVRLVNRDKGSECVS